MTSIYPVIVLYKIGLKAAMSYKTLLAPNFVEHFLVYDNSPDSYIQNMNDIPKGACYVRDTSNGGLSKAYNLGARKARELGYDRVLFLDQDTHFQENAWQEYQRNTDYFGIVAPMMKTISGECFSPVDISGWSPKVLQSIYPKEYSLLDYAVVNSGMCVPTALFEQTGGYNEGVRLDFSDFQFQVYVRKFAPKCLVIDTLAIQDFSNECQDKDKLLNRFVLYLKSARNFKADSRLRSLKHQYTVFRHMVALSVRTKSLIFPLKYLQIILLNKQ